MINDLRQLWRYKELLLMIAWRDIRVKYKQTLMGFLWAILMPAIIVCAGILVKLAVSTVSGKPLQLSQLATVSVKAVPWSFFVAAIRFATNSLMANPNLVTKIYFPKEIFPLAAVLSNLFDFVIAACLLAVILAVAQIGWSSYLLLAPLLVFLLFILTIGLGMILAALNLFYRDVKYLVEVILTFAIFFTPVLYEVEIFGDKARFLLLNPVAPLLEGLNACVVQHQAPSAFWISYSTTVSCMALLVGYWLFKGLEPRFAESI